MKTKPAKKQFIPRYCYTQGVHAILIARTHDSAVSLVALAAACVMHALNYICASIAVTAEMEAALGVGKVVKLPPNAFAPKSKVLRQLVKRARAEGAILLIDAPYDWFCPYHSLDEVLGLGRKETLSLVQSLAAADSPIEELSSCWSCQPDYSMTHIIGNLENDWEIDAEEPSLTASKLMELNLKEPIWHSGQITLEMLDVFNRRHRYRGLQPMPEVLCQYGPVPYCSLFMHDPHIDDVIQMLGRASDHAWTHVISKIAEEIM